MTGSRILLLLIAAAVCVASAGVGAADEVNVTFEGRFGGIMHAVAVSGDYAYIGQGQDFVVLDISNPVAPSESGRLITAGFASDIAVSGNYAYVADYTNGLMIVDVSNKAAPTLAGSYGTARARGVSVSGNYAYIAEGVNGLVIVDISNKAAPTLAGSYDTAGCAYEVSVSGNYAYVADYTNGLVVVDISNKAAPVFVGSYDTTGSALGVSVSGDYAYVADCSGLVIVDVSNKAAPTLAGSYDTAGCAWDVSVSGNYAYVADRSGNGLVIVDISNKATPTLAGSYGNAGWVWGVAVSGDYAYVADRDDNGLVIVDVSNKAAPTLAGSYGTAGWAWDVAVSGDYAYVADFYDLVVVDITDKSAPTLAGSYDTGYARGVSVSGNYAYVAAWRGLAIVDISNKAAPTLAGSSDTAGCGTAVTVSGDYAYVAGLDNGLVIVDVSKKEAPVLAGSYDTAGSAWDVSVSGNYAYVADYTNGLVIVDVSNKAAPTLAGSYDTAGYACGVSVSGDYAYVADYTNGLVIVDVSNKAAPTLAGSCDTGCAYGVSISGNYAYVAARGLVIVDISNKAAPVLAGSYDTAVSAWDVSVSGNYAYVADVSNGLVILRTDPTPQSLSVELYFDKEYFDTESHTIETKSHATKLEAGDKLMGYAKTTLTSGDYTVKTYIKMIMPDGTEKYAYSTSSPFCPECPLNFSDTKVSFRPDTWHAETKTWNWDVYKMTGTEPEGNYTWEFWYEDATTGKVLASSNTTYNFSRTTELLQEGRHKYFVRISNIDDDSTVYVNGVKMASATFNGNSGWKEISDKLLYGGENDIRFNVTNYPERYPENWTYKFELSTFTDESKIIWKDSCGSVGSCSCNNNQNTGEVYNKTVKLTITPLFTRETVDYTCLNQEHLNLYSMDYNDNPANSDYLVVISPLLAQAFVAEETRDQEKIDDKANQTEEALTAVLDVHPDAYIYFVDTDLGYKSDVEKLRADMYGLPFVHYRGPGGKIIDENPPHGKTKTYKEIVDAQITTHNFWENNVWKKYKDAVIRKTTDENYKPNYVLILGSAKEFPEYKISNWRVQTFYDTFSDSHYVQKQSDEYIAPIGRLPLQFAYNYSSSPQSFCKKAWIHTVDRFGEGLLAIDVVYRLQTPIKNNLIGKGYKNEDIKINEFIETHSDDMDVDLTDTSLFVAGWHGSTRKVGAHGGKLNISNVHPLVFASTSCLGSNTGDHENNKLGDPYDLFSSNILSGGASYVGNTRYADGDESIKIVKNFIENLVSEKATKTTLGDSWLQTIKNFDGSDYSRDQFRLLGDPALDTSALDDPIENHISTLPPQFSITINASYNETPINGYSLLNISISDNSSQNITYSLTEDQFATGTGAPKVPIIYIDIPMPVNQTIDNVSVVFGDSYTTSINLAEYVSILLTPDGAEVIPGIEIHGDYPSVNFTYSLVTVPDERLLKIQAIPVKYNIDSQIAELYRSINVTVHTKSFVEANITAKVHIDPSADYLALHQDENASLIISLYNDYSATENATDVSVTAEIPDNLEIVSANGTINGTIDGNTVTWDVNNLTTSGINSFKSVELLIQAPASIPDTTIEQINLTATYSNESGGVYEPTEVPIQVSLTPPDYVDLTVSNMVIHRPLKLGTPTNVTAVISNDGDINVTYVSVRLLIDGNESSGLIIDTPAMEIQSVNLSIGGLTPGKHQIATIVQPIGFETNITNNIATEDVDIYFAMLPPLSTTDPYNLPYGSTLPIRFTVKDNETSEFIPDYTVNVSILNSTNHIITSFNATSGILIDSDEAQYVVDLNTTNYPELLSGETYAVSVTFGEDDGLLSYATAYFTLEDLTPPRSITDLYSTTGTTWINWTWTNPPDLDFNHTMVYLNGTWQANTSNPFHNATGLSADASYEIGTHTVDTSGNVNTTWVNQTTKPIQKGDLNHDGNVTSTDVLIALEIAVSGEYVPEADIDENGYVNALDARMILQAAAGRIEL